MLVLIACCAILILVNVAVDALSVSIVAGIPDPSFKITKAEAVVNQEDVNPIYEKLSTAWPSTFPMEEYAKLVKIEMRHPRAVRLSFEFEEFMSMFSLQKDKLASVFESKVLPLPLPFNVAISMNSRRGNTEKNDVYTMLFDAIYWRVLIAHSSREEDENSEYRFYFINQDPCKIIVERNSNPA